MNLVSEPTDNVTTDNTKEYEQNRIIINLATVSRVKLSQNVAEHYCDSFMKNSTMFQHF